MLDLPPSRQRPPCFRLHVKQCLTCIQNSKQQALKVGSALGTCAALSEHRHCGASSADLMLLISVVNYQANCHYIVVFSRDRAGVLPT